MEPPPTQIIARFPSNDFSASNAPLPWYKSRGNVNLAISPPICRNRRLCNEFVLVYSLWESHFWDSIKAADFAPSIWLWEAGRASHNAPPKRAETVSVSIHYIISYRERNSRGLGNFNKFGNLFIPHSTNQPAKLSHASKEAVSNKNCRTYTVSAKSFNTEIRFQFP